MQQILVGKQRCTGVLKLFDWPEGHWSSLSQRFICYPNCLVGKVDERAVLKLFDWPEGKAYAFREAAFEYQDLKNSEKQMTNFVDNTSFSYEPALKKMYRLLLERVET